MLLLDKDLMNNPCCWRPLIPNREIKRPLLLWASRQQHI